MLAVIAEPSDFAASWWGLRLGKNWGIWQKDYFGAQQRARTLALQQPVIGPNTYHPVSRNEGCPVVFSTGENGENDRQVTAPRMTALDRFSVKSMLTNLSADCRAKP
jgi:hypothetical protein